MKSLIKTLLVAAVIAVPVASFAQENQPLTRAEVRAQLVQLEQAGYRPGDGDNTTYPVQIQAAEARVAAEQPARRQHRLRPGDERLFAVGCACRDRYTRPSELRCFNIIDVDIEPMSRRNAPR